MKNITGKGTACVGVRGVGCAWDQTHRAGVLVWRETDMGTTEVEKAVRK